MAEDVEEGQMAAGERAPTRRLRMGAGLFGMLLANLRGRASSKGGITAAETDRPPQPRSTGNEKRGLMG